MADQTKTIKVDVKNNFRKTAEDGKKMNKVVFDTKSAINDVLKSGDAYEKQLKDVNKIVKETPLNVRDMNKQIQAYQSIALSAGRETPVGKEALKKAADLRDRYIDIQNETKRLADDQKNLQGVMQLASTGVAGFGAVQSSMALVGGESEELRETMTKLMAAQTLLNSLNQIATALEKESSAMLLLKSIRTKILTVATYGLSTANGVATKGLKLFRLALIGTGIGALVVGVGLLIANFDKVKSVLTDVNKGFKEGGLLTKALMIAFAPLIATVKVFQKGLQAIGVLQTEQGKAEEKLNAQRIKQANEERARQKQAIVDLQDYREELNRQATEQQRYSSNRLKRLETEKKLAMGNAQEVAKIDEKISAEKLAQLERDKVAFIEGRKASLAETLAAVEANAAAEKRVQAGLSKAGKDFYKKNAEVEKAYYKLKEQLRTNDFVVLQEIRDEVNSVNADTTVKDKQELDKRRENYKRHLQDRLNAARKIEDLENSLLEDGIDKELEISADKNRRLIEDTKKNSKLKGDEKARLVAIYEEKAETEAESIRNKYRLKDLAEERKHQANKEKQENDYLDKIAKIQEENFEATLSDEELEIRRVEEKYFTLLEMAQGNADDLNEVEINRLNALNEVYVKHDNIRIASEKKSNDETVALKQTELNAKFTLITGSLDAINELVGAFTAKDEKNAKRQFKIQKALSLASAVTNTAQAVTSALATANPIPGGRFIEAGIAGTMGLANIVKIASSSFESPDTSGGGGGGGAQGPIASGGQPANFNIVGENNINQLAELQGQPTKAYVVSDDVTSAQAMDRKISDFATL